MDNKTRDTYGLIGKKLSHSFSHQYFSRKFEDEHIDAEYLNFELPTIEHLKDIIASHPTLKGLNVTIPYKEEVIPLLDELSPEAEAIGAVNVIKIEHISDGSVRLIGHNTDVIGFRESIRPLLTSNHTKAMILGTGGASKAVEHALRALDIKVQFVSRSHDKSSMTYSDLTDDIIFGHKVIVNTTPLGMYPNTMAMPDIIYYALTEEHLCYDLVYNPEKTMFLMACEAHGAQIKNGIEMLILQAEESWKIWNTNLD